MQLMTGSISIWRNESIVMNLVTFQFDLANVFEEKLKEIFLRRGFAYLKLKQLFLEISGNHFDGYFRTNMHRIASSNIFENTNVWCPMFDCRRCSISDAELKKKKHRFDVQYSMFIIRCSVFDDRYSMFIIRFSVFDVQYSIFSIWCSVFDVHYSMFSIRCWIFNVRYSMIKKHGMKNFVKFYKISWMKWLNYNFSRSKSPSSQLLWIT